MLIVSPKHLAEITAKYPDAKDEIEAWTTIAEGARWHHFQEVQAVIPDADNVDGYVIFDIRHNRYRLITVMHWAETTKKKQTMGHVHIRSFLTHKQYDNPDNWDKKYGRKKKK